MGLTQTSFVQLYRFEGKEHWINSDDSLKERLNLFLFPNMNLLYFAGEVLDIRISLTNSFIEVSVFKRQP